MGLRWWDAKRPTFTARARSSSESTCDGTTVLVEVGRAASDEDVPDAAGQLAGAARSDGIWQSEQVAATTHPSSQAPPALGLADASKAIRADLKPALHRGPQPDILHQQRRGDRRGRVQKTGCDASWRHRADGLALDAAVAPQPYRSTHRFYADLRWPPNTPLAEAMPVKSKTVGTVGRPAAARAVARPSGLDVGLDFRPRLDVEGGVAQGQNCFGHSMAGRSNRDNERCRQAVLVVLFLAGGREWRVGRPASGPRSLPIVATVSNFSTLGDPARGLPLAFGINQRERVDARRRHRAQALARSEAPQSVGRQRFCQQGVPYGSWTGAR